MTDMNGREIILDILLEVSGQKEYSNILITAVLDKYDYLDSREKAFIKRVSEGCIERRIQIDYVLNLYSKTPVHKMKPLIRELLRMSTYQLLFMEHVPDAAVCNEAVKLAKKRKFQALQGYVNGVLRNIARGREEITYPDRETSCLEYLSVYYSMPMWLVEHFVEAYGQASCEKILQAYLESQPVGIRLRENLKDEEIERLISAWRKAGIRALRHPYLPYAAEIEKADGIRRMAGYEEGLFAVQDVSSMLVVEAAGIRPGDTVIDVCAAPGGKAIHLAEALRGTGHVEARDLTDYKVQIMQDNIMRSGLSNIETVRMDARRLDEASVGKADIVIADLPCSGLGVLGRKPDLKYKMTPEKQKELTALQREILSVVKEYVKSGGRLLYSTCTIHRGENEDNAGWFVRQNPEFGLIREQQMLPGRDGGDGFYIAMFRRN